MIQDIDRHLHKNVIQKPVGTGVSLDVGILIMPKEQKNLRQMKMYNKGMKF